MPHVSTRAFWRVTQDLCRTSMHRRSVKKRPQGCTCSQLCLLLAEGAIQSDADSGRHQAIHQGLSASRVYCGLPPGDYAASHRAEG